MAVDALSNEALNVGFTPQIRSVIGAISDRLNRFREMATGFEDHL